ncbi:lymphatic vessel endothelial hyaluronic acid receptor 1-like [Nothobranchius furzeri]|uniref:Lymphatic vessel endothelial hyaluronic acid receptor 1-like n=2 Tax=Nothobranchius TaxID=28779 RepID=A0A9D2YQY0_NOTFU|nr:lymphatic vessel endothelial hyaluronic acid receptor 1-like [Nothobranchius furzeri]
MFKASLYFVVNRFGWLAEQIAVIPRVKPEKNCGSGKTGAVTWSASPEKQFGVFCFNDSALSDQDETVTTLAAGLPSSPATSSQAALTRSSSPLTTLVTSTRSPPSTEVTTRPKETSLDFKLLMETTRTSSPSSPSPKTDPPHHLITSKKAEVSLEFLTSPQAAKPPLGAGPTALLSVGLVLLLLIAAGVGWYCRPRPFGWRGRLLNDDTETEMWKKTDIYCEPEADLDEDEVDKTYSSNITLCVDPCLNQTLD